MPGTADPIVCGGGGLFQIPASAREARRQILRAMQHILRDSSGLEQLRTPPTVH